MVDEFDCKTTLRDQFPYGPGRVIYKFVDRFVLPMPQLLLATQRKDG